jgi:D-amino-acid oxidase
MTAVMTVTVVGAGINGLSTAAELAWRGHRVTVIAEELHEATVSMVAGAVWFPFQVGAEDRVRVRAWSLRTRQWMTELAVAAPSAGVDLLTAYEISAGDEWPWWADGLEVDRVPAPVTGAPLAWRFAAPRAQPALLLRHLAAQLTAPVVVRRLTSFEELVALTRGCDAVVNCTGLGARALVGDPALQGLFGQVAIAGCGSAALDVSITDDRDPADLFYVIPRRDELVLGGIARPVGGAIALAAEPAITDRILAHAARLGIAIGEVTAVRVGLRPYRPMVRLERDVREPRLLHNYGHGGSGFTLCHGTAVAVADLVEAG